VVVVGELIEENENEIVIKGATELLKDTEFEYRLGPIPLSLDLVNERVGEAETSVQRQYMICLTKLDVFDDHEICNMFRVFWGIENSQPAA